jgi:hypothetical protein
MKNFQLYLAAIVLGVIALIGSVLYLMGDTLLGYHPTRGYVGLGAATILLIIGIIGMIVRPRGRR